MTPSIYDKKNSANSVKFLQLVVYLLYRLIAVNGIIESYTGVDNEKTESILHFFNCL